MLRAMRSLPVGVAVAMLAVSPGPATADEFDRYRELVDNYKNYTMAQRDEAIGRLETLRTADVEKSYLLGMLNVIQGMQSMVSMARRGPDRPRIEDVLRDPTVQKYFASAEHHYTVVERSQPGYKHIYCKLAELYRFASDEKGLEKTTIAVGRAVQNERTRQCKGLLEDIAEQYASRGRAHVSRTIYRAAIESWSPYPTYMLEALGDIEDVLANRPLARSWWERCIKEAETGERQARCQKKLDERT